MSASNNKSSVWQRLKGIFEARPVATPPIAAHLRSLSPEVAARVQGEGSHRPVAAHLRSLSPELVARLKGAGSQPPKTASTPVITAVLAPAPNVSAHASPSKLTIDDLPWPLLRSTGLFHAEHAKVDRALAMSTAELVAQLEGEVAKTQEITTVSSVARRNLAAQLAVIARFNQPVSRGANISAKSAALREHAKISTYADTGKRPATSAKSAHDMAARPQAIVIDLAAAKMKRRVDKARRAA